MAFKDAKKVFFRTYISVEEPRRYYISLDYLDADGELLHRTMVAKQMLVDMLTDSALLEEKGFTEVPHRVDDSTRFRLPNTEEVQEENL